mmetsp:Transcript_21657/g.54949  ORF Transcript_21657/g.54949 Transcript_21657/m.54949 type:complete len:200 (-) Transcript_21657:555-1154(-)
MWTSTARSASRTRATCRDCPSPSRAAARSTAAHASALWWGPQRACRRSAQTVSPRTWPTRSSAQPAGLSTTCREAGGTSGRASSRSTMMPAVGVAPTCARCSCLSVTRRWTRRCARHSRARSSSQSVPRRAACTTTQRGQRWATLSASNSSQRPRGDWAAARWRGCAYRSSRFAQPSPCSRCATFRTTTCSRRRSSPSG